MYHGIIYVMRCVDILMARYGLEVRTTEEPMVILFVSVFRCSAQVIFTMPYYIMIKKVKVLSTKSEAAGC